MGYSCTAAASDVYNAWEEGCRQQTGSQNTYEFLGKSYFFERGKEQPDGGITGSVYLHLPNNMARKVSTFKIGADGRILRAHSVLKQFAVRHKRQPTRHGCLLFV